MKKDEFRIEHYKSMREEYMQLMLYFSRLWNFKLSTIGAVIAVSIFNEKILGTESSGISPDIDAAFIISVGLLTLPVVAFLIDLKVVEIGMQVKRISDHLKNNFRDIEEISEWENTFWKNNSISSTRTILSLILYVGASMVILVASFIAVSKIQENWDTGLLIVGIILMVLPIIAIFTFIPKLLN